jgi:hypothetical protein
MELSKELKELFIETSQELTGYAQRVFQAKVVNILDKGGQRQAEKELNWNRGTTRKGQAELSGKFGYIDQFRQRGRKPAEHHLPNLMEDIKVIAEAVSQTDPTFQTTQLYIRLSAAEVRKALIEQQGYCDETLPCVDTIGHKLNKLGYSLKKVKKSQPVHKKPETDAIFEQLAQVNTQADTDETMLRLSVDAKATVLLGLLSRGGYSRVTVKALDHDYRPDEKVTPVGIFLPQYNETYIFLTTSPVTSDLIVDCIHDLWVLNEERFPWVKTLVINQDNGPECHSRRTQFMKRIADLADQTQRTIQLAYYPPYHSKYNPIERVWGVLENYWNGSLLDTLQTVFRFAENMTYNGVHPVVEFVETVYHTGVKLTKQAMDLLEERFERFPGLEKYFVTISPLPF